MKKGMKKQDKTLRRYICPHCLSGNLSYFGYTKDDRRRYKCHSCDKTFIYPKVKRKEETLS